MNTNTPDKKMNPASKHSFVTPAGRGQYVFNPSELQHVQPAPKYTAIEGVWLSGEMIILGVQGFAPGKAALPHQHANEQWMYLLEGGLDVTVDGVAAHAGPGTVVFIPANTEHSVKADEKLGCKLIVVKDTRADVAPDGMIEE